MTTVSSSEDLNSNIDEIRNRQVVAEMGKIFSVVSNFMVIPLFLLFWLADLVYAPDVKWHTLLIRLSVVPLVFFGRHVLSKERSYFYLQVTMSVYTIVCAMAIHLIIFAIGETDTGYYAGLNLIAVGALSFIPFQKRFLALCAVGIYLPYYIWLVVHFLSGSEALNQTNDEALKTIIVNSFFILGTLTISGIIHHFNEELRRAELKSKLKLSEELINRERIIQEKTREATELRKLSMQFSPQVVNAIQNGQIRLNEQAGLKKICVTFIDIVGSTERVNSLSAKDFQEAIEMFLKITIECLLKYDLTIDKFQGDGVLAFANCPVEYQDFALRTCNAVFEIKNEIQKRSDYFQRLWKGSLDLRVGIALGYANVGFFGDQKSFSSYSAVGRPMALAARICSSANPNQILVDKATAEAISGSPFVKKIFQEAELKGFNNERIEIYEISNTVDNEIVGYERI